MGTFRARCALVRTLRINLAKFKARPDCLTRANAQGGRSTRRPTQRLHRLLRAGSLLRAFGRKRFGRRSPETPKRIPDHPPTSASRAPMPAGRPRLPVDARASIVQAHFSFLLQCRGVMQCSHWGSNGPGAWRAGGASRDACPGADEGGEGAKGCVFVRGRSFRGTKYVV